MRADMRLPLIGHCVNPRAQSESPRKRRFPDLKTHQIKSLVLQKEHKTPAGI